MLRPPAALPQPRRDPHALPRAHRYHAVTSPDFDARLVSEAPDLTPEERQKHFNQEARKRFAIHDFLEHLVDILERTGMSALCLPISVGFSDDDAHNVAAVQDYITRVLARRFPSVKFCIYDTSDASGAHKIEISGQMELPLE